MSSVEQRIEQLEAQVKELQSIVNQQNQNIVEVCASHLQQLFQNQTMMDSIAYRMLLAGANALVFKAQQAEDAPGELVVIEGYIPGSLRASIAEDGSFSIDQQLKGSTNQAQGWESAVAQFEEKGILDTLRELLAAYGAEANRNYFITDTVTLKKHRARVSSQLTEAGFDPSSNNEQMDKTEELPAAEKTGAEGDLASVYRATVVVKDSPDQVPLAVNIVSGTRVIKLLENDQAVTLDVSELVEGDVFNTVNGDTVLVLKSIQLADPAQPDPSGLIMVRPAGLHEEVDVRPAVETAADIKYTFGTEPLNPEEGGPVELTAVFHTEDEVYVKRDGKKLVLHPADVQVGDEIEVSRNHCIVRERVTKV